MPDNAQSTEQTATLSPKQDRVIEALLAGNTIMVAAAAAGINDKTARRWLKLPHFQAAYKAAQKTMFDQALTGLLLKVDKAIETLDRNMNSVLSPAATQVRAAQIVIEQAVATHKMSELEDKLKELELAVKGPFTR